MSKPGNGRSQGNILGLQIRRYLLEIRIGILSAKDKSYRWINLLLWIHKVVLNKIEFW